MTRKRTSLSKQTTLLTSLTLLVTTPKKETKTISSLAFFIKSDVRFSYVIVCIGDLPKVTQIQ